MDDTKTLPTHVEEIDGLRLQNAMLKKNEAVRVANEAIAAWEKARTAAWEKYHLNEADAINLDTFEIKRA